MNAASRPLMLAPLPTFSPTDRQPVTAVVSSGLCASTSVLAMCAAQPCAIATRSPLIRSGANPCDARSALSSTKYADESERGMGAAGAAETEATENVAVARTTTRLRWRSRIQGALSGVPVQKQD